MESQVNLRISTEERDGRLTVHVAGRLAANGIAELEEACGSAAWVRLDLSQLLNADDEGTRLLSRMREAGVELFGTPPFVDLLILARSAPELPVIDTTEPKGEPE